MVKTMSDGNHPVWSLARLVTYMSALVAVLVMTAQNFDNTELKTILTMFFVGAGAEGATSLLSSLKGGHK